MSGYTDQPICDLDRAWSVVNTCGHKMIYNEMKRRLRLAEDENRRKDATLRMVARRLEEIEGQLLKLRAERDSRPTLADMMRDIDDEITPVRKM